jgi:hypothetical protein
VTPEQAKAIARYQDAEHRIAVALRTASAERIVEIAQRMEAIADGCEPDREVSDHPRPAFGAATKVRDLADWNAPGQRASLYRMDPPHEGASHVIVSAINDAYAHETYIFASGEDAKVSNWTEMFGSAKGTTSHEDALRGAGYEVSR